MKADQLVLGHRRVPNLCSPLLYLLLSIAWLRTCGVWAQAPNCVQCPSGLVAWWPGDGSATNLPGNSGAQSDHFNDGNDHGWLRYDPIGSHPDHPDIASFTLANGTYRI